MTRSFSRRMCALVGVLVAGTALLASAGPASAAAPYSFQSNCTNIGTTGGAVVVPAGTSIGGGVPVAVDTNVVAVNTAVTFPSGATAIVNEVTVVGGTTTRNAIRFLTGPNAGVIVGQVTCSATTTTANALVSSVPVIAVSCSDGGVQPAPAGGVATRLNVTVGFPAGAECAIVGGDAVSANAAGQYNVNPYPLAVQLGDAGGTADLAAPVAADSGSSSNLLLVGGIGALALAALAQVVIGRRMSQRRADATA